MIDHRSIPERLLARLHSAAPDALHAWLAAQHRASVDRGDVHSPVQLVVLRAYQSVPPGVYLSTSGNGRLELRKVDDPNRPFVIWDKQDRMTVWSGDQKKRASGMLDQLARTTYRTAREVEDAEREKAEAPARHAAQRAAQEEFSRKREQGFILPARIDNGIQIWRDGAGYANIRAAIRAFFGDNMDGSPKQIATWINDWGILPVEVWAQDVADQLPQVGEHNAATYSWRDKRGFEVQRGRAEEREAMSYRYKGPTPEWRAEKAAAIRRWFEEELTGGSKPAKPGLPFRTHDPYFGAVEVAEITRPTGRFYVFRWEKKGDPHASIYSVTSREWYPPASCTEGVGTATEYNPPGFLLARLVKLHGLDMLNEAARKAEPRHWSAIDPNAPDDWLPRGYA